MKLFQYYKNAVIFPSLIVLVITVIYSIIDNYNYKSEWLTAEAVVLMSVITAFIYCLLISGLSLTIFLNKFEKIKTNKILSALTWFVLPFGCISIVLLHEIIYTVEYDPKFSSDNIYPFIMNIPFVFGLIWTYVKYRKTAI